ncbi:MAG: hypothetical protein WA747_04025 [Steroidobacteraceae bacterium]
MSARTNGRRRARIRHAAQNLAETSVAAAHDEQRVLVAAVEDLVERLGTVADARARQLRRRAEAALDRAKDTIAERDEGHTTRWALLSVAAVCAIVIGVWTGRAVLSE